MGATALQIPRPQKEGKETLLTEQVSWQSEGLILEKFVKNCTPLERLPLKRFTENFPAWEGPHAASGEECEDFS